MFIVYQQSRLFEGNCEEKETNQDSFSRKAYLLPFYESYGVKNLAALKKTGFFNNQ